MKIQINKIFNNPFKVINQKHKFERTIIFLWVFLPFIMMLSKSITDFIITLTGIIFLTKNIYLNSWDWLKIPWVKFSFLFILMAIISSIFSFYPKESFLNGFSWIRFPLFLLAVSFWLVKEKQILYLALFVNLISLIFIFLLMGAEIIFTDNQSFTWPFRNPLNGPFIHRIGLIFFSISFIILFSNMKFKTQVSIFILISLLFSLISGHRAGTFSFFIIICMSLFLSDFSFKSSLKIIFLIFTLFISYFYINPDQLDRYFLGIINLNNSSLIQYIGQWKTGINTFFNNFLIGVGPTNVQNYLEHNLIENFDPFRISEHPHNHYIQAFAETGIIGGLAYICIFVSMGYHLYTKTNFNYNFLDNLIIRGVFITSICLFWPFANNYDLFGQQQNAFLWYVLSIMFVSYKTIKSNE